MRSIIYILIFLNVFVFTKSANAQLWRYLNDTGKTSKNDQKQDAVYTINSLEGILVKVKVVRKVLSDGITRIKTSTDSLGIESTMGIDTVYHLNKNLLAIIYSPHGGSNDGYMNTLIVSISKGKFRIAMEVMSQHVYGNGGPEGLYDLRIRLTNKNISDLNLLVNIHEVDSSTTKGAKHYNRRKKFVLNYDKDKSIFYNSTRHIDANVNIWNSKTDKIEHKFIKGDYPTIKLDEYEYFFIDQTWYQGGVDVSTGRYSLGAYCQRLPTGKKKS